MKFLKRFIRWTIGIICGLYLCLQVAMHIPFTQDLAGDLVASALHDAWDWDISIGRIQLGLWNRIIIDDVCLKDKQDSTLIHASRLAAKIDIAPLMDGRISIANAQLFGTRINIYQEHPDAKPNFQFLIDTFSSNDTTEGNGTHLHIGTLVLRKVDLQWDQRWKEHREQGRLDPSHLSFSDIAITAHLRTFTPDSINLTLNRFSFTEKSGLTVNNLSFDLAAGLTGGHVKDFELSLPNSYLHLPSVVAFRTNPEGIPNMQQLLQELAWSAEARAKITPSDLKTLSPALEHADSPVSLEITAFGSEGCANVHRLELGTANGELALDVKAFVQNIHKKPELIADIRSLRATSRLQTYIAREFLSREGNLSPVIDRLDTVNITGRIRATEERQTCNLNVNNHAFNLQLDADRWQSNDFKARIKAPVIEVAELLSDGTGAIGDVSLETEIHGTLKDKSGKPEIHATTTLPYFMVGGREYRDARLVTDWKQECLSVDAGMEDPVGSVSLQMAWNRKQHGISGNVLIDNMHAERLGMGSNHAGKNISVGADLDIAGTNLDNMKGAVHVKGFCLTNNNGDTVFIEPYDLVLATAVDEQPSRSISIKSKSLNLNASGQFRLTTLAGTLQNALHRQLPDLIPERKTTADLNDLQFDADIQDTVLLRYLANKDIRIPQTATIQGRIQGTDKLDVYADIPQLFIGKEHLRNSLIDISGTTHRLSSKVMTERRQKHGFVSLNLQATANDNRLRTILGFDDHNSPRTHGEADITTLFSRQQSGDMNVNTWVAPSNIIISDTLWRIHPATVNWHDKVITVEGLQISRSSRQGLGISGRISSSEEDSLVVNLQHINVEYILDLVNFHSVEFSGFATGNALATGLLSHPRATANLRVDGFCFNGAPLGTLQADATWGQEPHILKLDATISDPANQHLSRILGDFNIGDKGRRDGLDLRINTRRFNLAFLNKFTEGIFDNVNGRLSGYCRLFGPFSAIDIEGDLMLDHAALTLPMLGTTYSVRQDSVHVVPGQFSIHALLRDSLTSTSLKPGALSPHTAVIDGALRHDHFKHLTYDFNVNANKFLAYDKKEFGENSFYATCIISGDVGIRGVPGRLTVDVNATPEAGTTFNYNVSTPASLTESNFITFHDADSLHRAATVRDPHDGKEDIAFSSDMFLNFNLWLTPDAKMQLLMDSKSGDMIEMQGNGRIMAKYHNKGRFNIYGTYRVQNGQYRLNLREIIRKDFTFRPNGTITFGGDALKADLNLKAVYSVPGVSLDDLTSHSLGFSKTRVDCIMNLSGTAEYPTVEFDFDLPNATEDERQMVRSVVSTEEERNMQAIYLLGLGRFYNYNATGADQSSAAINSLLSSTLSSGLNQFISNAVGTSKWSFGTNLKTGDDGWRNMDVEGMIGGSLFDDRLLLSGNFGYREKYYTQRSFISDVTVEYLLTRNGNISIKAYNQANDRYFVQSSLNTQGIGIQFKKDFNRVSDLFQWLKPKKKEE